MNIIFLDIDGVLNTLQISDKPFESNFGQVSRDGYYYQYCMPEDLEVSNKQSVMWLNKLCEETNSKIVITSTWRMGVNGLRCTKKALYNSGLHKDIDILGFTPIIHNATFNIRGNEIKMYLNDNPEISNYVILDDDKDMLPEQMFHLVKVNSDYGFGFPDYIKAKEILAGSTCDAEC